MHDVVLLSARHRSSMMHAAMSFSGATLVRQVLPYSILKSMAMYGVTIEKEQFCGKLEIEIRWIRFFDAPGARASARCAPGAETEASPVNISPSRRRISRPREEPGIQVVFVVKL